MSETSTKELDSMDKVTEDAATGSTAIKKGATAGEKNLRICSIFKEFVIYK